jgi:hypothetical protein
MLAGIPLTFALCFNASAIDQKRFSGPVPPRYITYSKCSSKVAKGAEIGRYLIQIN